MKIVIAGDNHGDELILKKIVEQNADADYFLHTGDSEMLENNLHPFTGVRGNRDVLAKLPNELEIDTPIGKLFLTHGHTLFCLSTSKIKKRGCKIFVHGHTHRHYVNQIDDIYVCSPGSTSRPRDSSNGTYLIIKIENDKASFDFVYF